jgi:tRNA A58 N-methylase Trm61
MEWLSVLLHGASLVALGTLLYHILRANKGGAPFIPSMGARKVVRHLGIRPDDVVYELGCGDGRCSVAAAKAGAARVVGYDISGLWVALARLRARLSGVSDRTTFSTRDIRTCDPSDATLVYLYLMPAITNELARGALLRLKPGARVVSSSFSIDTTANPGFRLIKKEQVGLTNLLYFYERV